MRNLKDERTKIFPSTTRVGKELPSSYALDSPSIMSKFATPAPPIDSNMSHVIDDATCAMHNAYDETTVGERSNFKKFPTHTQDNGDA